MDQEMKDQLMAAAHNCRANGMLAAETAIYEAIKLLGGGRGLFGDTKTDEAKTDEAEDEAAATAPKRRGHR